VAAAIEQAAAAEDASALTALQALSDGTLRYDSGKRLLIQTPSGLKDALTGAAATAQGALQTPVMDNSLRRTLDPALASLRLAAPSVKVRLTAARELGRPSAEMVPVLR